MKEICPFEQCTGCAACINICSKSAITMVPDKLGFYYPVINENLCVDCGLCELSCPNNHLVKKEYPQQAFVGHAADAMEQLSSTSGGIATAISRWCLRQGGIVYGCSAQDCQHVKHVRVTQDEDLEWLKGSKYVQSNIGTIYVNIRKDLRDDKMVLFIGTPCQCAGLKSFLRKDYNKLYTIDFVCHGVPSQRILNEELKLHVSESELKSARISFRRKVNFGKNYRTQYGIYLKDGAGHDIYAASFPKNTYVTGFLSALFYRESCYQCKYSTPERVSDITVGDYANLDNEYSKLSGSNLLLSMITLNTIKGKEIVYSFNKEIEYAPILYSKLVSAQGQLRSPMKRHCNRDKFYNLFSTDNYDKIVRKLIQDDLKRIKKINRKIALKKILMWIPFMKILINKRRE